MAIEAGSGDWLLHLEEVRARGEMLRVHPIGHLTYQTVVDAIVAQGFNADFVYRQHREADTFYVIQHGNSILIQHQTARKP